MDVFLVIMIIAGLSQIFLIKGAVYKATSIFIVAHAVGLLLWSSKPSMGMIWLLIYLPFFLYMIFITWFHKSIKLDNHEQN